MKKRLTEYRKNILLSLFFFVLVFPVSGLAQEEKQGPSLKEMISNSDQAEGDLKTEQKKLVKVGPDDEYNRGVPRSSVAGYFKAVKGGDLQRAAQYLDLRNLPKGHGENDGPELARQLKVVLDRSLWIEMDLLSTDPKGHADDGLPSYRDLVGQLEVNEKKYDVLMQRIPRGDGVFIWKFSSSTVRDIPELYKALGYGPVGEVLSQQLSDIELLGLKLWQWVFLLLILVAAVIITFPVVRLISWLVRRRSTELSAVAARFINGPAHVVLVLVLTRQNFDLVQPSLTARAIFEAGTIYIIAMTWMMVRLVTLLREFWVEKLNKQGRDQAIVLVRPTTTAINIVIVLLGLLLWLDNVGFSVTSVLAGLGIGGIAIALATQKSIENFIGALTLYLAAPVKVGDFCRFGDTKGKVEEIGLRATKIRTLEQSVIIVPNAEFSNMQIENMAERKRFRFNPVIRLHIETTPDQLRYILIEFKKLMYAHSMIADAPLRVRFAGFGEYSLDVEINCYVETKDINVFKGVVEDVNLRIMDIVSAAGTRIAIPMAIEVQGETNSPDTGLKQQAERQVEKWRSNGKLSMELSEDEIGKIKNSIPYPVQSN